ncbi:uncharacterized protein LOC106874882 isoform X2 [Octopus bimaculoides]|uniref:uncharacterized protein LOC106874882 isoform X2 n=1 Tax=Octopus bimaculoides TaxID=37653 RepID=UPI00071CC8E2|nr:uncharacterized protein LOC106874882 isoform X2 [Octopus bimaculoides]|eukprot:XP_014778277.1 PREDICTED: uncharacterized protein LOC106874882 isoform X2 [Octopus bimaculoides]
MASGGAQMVAGSSSSSSSSGHSPGIPNIGLNKMAVNSGSGLSSGHSKACDVVIVSEYGTMQTHHRNRQLEPGEILGCHHPTTVTMTNDDKLSISPPEKLTSDVQITKTAIFRKLLKKRILQIISPNMNISKMTWEHLSSKTQTYIMYFALLFIVFLLAFSSKSYSSSKKNKKNT